MKFRRKIVWLSILTSTISLSTLVPLSILNQNNTNETLSNTLSNDLARKPIVADFQDYYAAEIKTELDTLVAKSKPGSDQAELKTFLTKLFPTEMAALKPDAIIDGVVSRANSTVGYLYVAFGVYEGTVGSLIMVKQHSEYFELTKKGTTKINLKEFNDTNETYDNIKQKLENNDISYLVNNGILINTAKNSTVKITYSEETNPKRFEITNLIVENAVGAYEQKIESYDQKITITTLPQDIKTTSLLVKLDYLNDPTFRDLITADKFANYLNTNKDTIDAKDKLVTIVNATTSPDTTIKIKEAIVENTKNVKVTYTVTNYFNQYGEQVQGEMEISVIYTALPINRVMTLVSFENLLEEPNKDYAYQYNQNDIQKMLDDDIKNKTNKIIINPADNTTATINSFDVNNRTATILIDITLNNIYDADGNIKASDQYTKVRFIAKTTITAATNVVRNKTAVAENIREVDAMDDATKKQWAEKYIEVINKSNEPATTMTIQSVEKQKKYSTYANSGIETSSVYIVKASLTNYFKYNAKFEFDPNSSGAVFTVYINAKMNRPTSVMNTVEANGISADTTIADFTVTDLLTPSLANNENILKEWIVSKTNANAIFEDYKTNMVTADITTLSTKAVAGENYSIEVTLTLNDAYQFDGTTSPTEFTFKITNLSSNIWTKEKKQVEIIGDSTKFASAYAKENNNDFKNSITQEIKAKNGTNEEYFEKLPPLEANDEVVQTEFMIDDVNGQIVVLYKLPKFYVKGLIETPDNNNPNAVIYQAIIKGFKTEANNPFANMDINIDANKGQLNTSVNQNNNNFDKVDAFNYKNAIKDKINNFLNSTTSMPEDMLNNVKGEMANFDTNAQIGELMIATKGMIDVTAKVKVVYPQLAQLSNDVNWNSGYVFNISNATYANTDVTTTNNENTKITVEEYEKLTTNIDRLSALNTSLNFVSTEIFDANNYNDPTKLEITLKEKDPITGKVIVVFKFKEFFINNQVVKDYEMSFNFKFKSNTDSTSVNFIKDGEIAGIDLEADWGTDNGKTVSQIYAEIKAGTINIQDIINNKKDVILNANILTQYPNLVLTYKDVAFLNNNNDVYLSIDIGIKEDANDQKEVIEQLTVGKFSFKMAMTDPTAATVPNDVTFDSIANVGSGNDITNGTAKGRFINYNDGKTPDANSDITITSAKLEIAKKTSSYQIAFVDFTFNGIYTAADDIRSFISDYVVKLKMEFNQNGTLIKTHIVWSGGQDQYISAKNINSSNNNNWIIFVVIGSLLISLIAIYATKSFYVRSKQKKWENK